MKIKLVSLALFFLAVAPVTRAQHVRVRLAFPVGINVVTPGPAPYSGAIWIGPEWRWRGRRYEFVSGYWAGPHRYKAVWVPGYWKYTRQGYRWVPGCWK